MFAASFPPGTPGDQWISDKSKRENREIRDFSIKSLRKSPGRGPRKGCGPGAARDQSRNGPGQRREAYEMDAAGRRPTRPARERGDGGGLGGTGGVKKYFPRSFHEQYFSRKIIFREKMIFPRKKHFFEGKMFFREKILFGLPLLPSASGFALQNGRGAMNEMVVGLRCT